MAMPTIALPLPRYTVADLDRLPEDGQRYELLEGWLLVTPMPGSVHQALVGRLFRSFDEHVGDTGAGFVYPGGGVVRGTDTRLVPDVLVVSRQGRPGLAWDAMADRWLAIEVLSPSTQLYDRSYKVNAYLALGLREVWLVDARARVVEVHRTIGVPPERVADTLRWQAPGTDAAPLVLRVGELFADAGAIGDGDG